MHGTIPAKQSLDQESLSLIEDFHCRQAARSFWAYRKLMNPGMLIGWWQEEIAGHLQQFVEDFRQGKRPKLMLLCGRQMGKSVQVQDLMSWLCGVDPTINVIFTSYSERLGIRANLRLQRAFDNPIYQKIFPKTQISPSGRETSFQRNHNIIEFVDQGGAFRNTTVGGRVTGESLDLGVVDDPIKGREEANSELIRDKTWEWFTDDFMGCFSQRAALLTICTRFHIDDPAGRMIEQMPGIKVLRYPALAEKDEKHRKKGEALFPELKSKEFLEERRKVLTQAGFMSIYQQSPINIGGGLLPIEKFRIEKFIPSKDIKRSVRYIDKAGSENSGAYTACVLMHLLRDNTIFISDVQRGQWSALKREQIIKQTVQIDANQFKSYKVVVEQEPGSGGLESAENTIRNLVGYSVEKDKVTGSKEIRADPFAAQVQAGNVALLGADWNRAYLEEAEQFPGSKYKDQIDASSGAFNKLTLGIQYDDSMFWIDGKAI